MRDRTLRHRTDLIDVLGKFRPPLVALILVNTIGTLGFMLIDDYPFLDAAYQTVFTLTTVGYQETHPLSDLGKVFVMFLIFGGVAVWTYALGVTLNVMINEDLIGKLKETVMEHRVRKFSEHFIIAGYTEVSRQVVSMLERQGIRYVVVDDDSERLALAEEDHVQDVLALDPFRNDTYRAANVADSRGLIATFSEDSDNITVVVTANILEEEIDKPLLVITVANRSESRDKLRKVGADLVILPHELIAQRISAMALHPPDPDHSSFLDRVAFGEFLNLDIREVRVGRGSALDGVAIRESGIRDAMGSHILGIQRRGRQRIMLMPNPDIHIHAGDLVLVMGTLSQLEKLPQFLRGPEGEAGEEKALPETPEEQDPEG